VPAVLSHGLNSTRTDRSRYHQMFDWTGTTDFTPWLCVPEALRTMEAMIPGGWPAIMERNRLLALKARGLLCAALGVAPSDPDDMQGSMAVARLPDPAPGEPIAGPLGIDPLYDRLYDRWRVQAPITAIASPAARLLRVSAQLYNSVEQYEYAARAIVAALRHQ
jgi:isopenicillin-N epimerase